MASLLGLVRRWRAIITPPVAKKNEEPLKFGILGAANIGPMALISPAKSHPDVVIQCVAARDKKKAQEYAKKHGIPEVKDGYQDILDDQDISCVYIPLPNGLHYEWALRALKAGKHVLLEKPSVSNGEEAAALFRSLDSGTIQAVTGTPLVLLEAFHYRFQPPWHKFLSFVDSANVARVRACLWVPGLAFDKNDIRFKYDLAGGAMMDLATYPLSTIRLVFGGVAPVECTESKLQMLDPPDDKCDYAFQTKWRFPNGGEGEAVGSLRASLVQTLRDVPTVEVSHRLVVVGDEEVASVKGAASKVGEGQGLVRARKVTIHNFLVGALWHRIDVEDDYTVVEKSVIEDGLAAVEEKPASWKEKNSYKAYTWREAGLEGKEDLPGEDWWITYRHQLEQFVERVRGRAGNGVWVDNEDSIIQMQMIDMAYQKAGVDLRKSKEFEL